MSAVKESAAIESTLAAIASHPTRVQAFMVLAERTASPKELEVILNKPVSHISYHVRELERLGAVEVIEEKQRRGATEHFYRAIERPMASDEDWEGMSPGERAAVSRHILQLHVAETALALDEGTFDERPNRSLLRFPLVVDEEGFSEVNALHTEIYERTCEIQAKSNARRSQNLEDSGIRAMATWMFYELPAN